MIQSSGLPMVSVIIPAFNEEKYIEKTLDCITSQDYPDFEVIVINNASTDQTAAVVSAYQQNHPDKLIKLVDEPRQGTQFARECGRQNASGTLLAQLDADCLPDIHWIATGVGLLKNNRTVAVTGPYSYVDCPRSTRLYTFLGQGLFYKSVNFLTQVLHRGGILIGGNCFIRKEILDKMGGYNTALTFYGDDVDTAARLSVYGKIRYSNRLRLKTSFRRFAALGFWKVQKKYSRFFWDSVFRGKIDNRESAEFRHPR